MPLASSLAAPPASSRLSEPANNETVRAPAGPRSGLPFLWGSAMLAGVALGAALSRPEAMVLGLALLALLISAALLWRALHVERRFTRALQSFAADLAAGDLTRRLDPRGEPAHALLYEQFNAMAHALGRVFIELSRMLHELSSVAHESSANAQHGEHSVRQQRDVTQSAAAALEELTVGLTLASDNAHSMAATARETETLAAKGRACMSQLVTTLDSLGAALHTADTSAGALQSRSQEIGGIADLISEIAARTKLLALNAAIEAQRAGPQGAGFGVVADEVGKLSERTTQATRDIAERIAAIQAEVKAMQVAMRELDQCNSHCRGDSAVAVSALDAVAALATTTGVLASETANAAVEQSVACQSIARDIESVACLADNNERLTHDNSELAHYLDQLGRQLSVLVQNFRHE